VSKGEGLFRQMGEEERNEERQEFQAWAKQILQEE
jgi:hypothetical protein